MGRKFRWTFEAEFQGITSKPLFCKLTSRPVIEENEKEINYLSGEMFKPGKRQELTTTFFDLADTNLNPLFEIIGKVYNLSADTGIVDKPYDDSQAGIGKLVLKIPTRSTCCHCGKTDLNDMFSPRGPLEPLEEWTLGGLWPTALDFGCCGDDECNIKWSYNSIIYKYLGQNFSVVQVPPVEQPPVERPIAGAKGLGTLGWPNKCECPKPDSKTPPG